MPSPLSGVLSKFRAAFGLRQAPTPKVAPPPAPKAQSQPWGSTLFADYNTGQVTSNSQSRGRENIPLYYDAKINKLTHRQTEIPAYFGLTADVDDDMRQALKMLKAQQDEAQRQLAVNQEQSIRVSGRAGLTSTPYVKPTTATQTPANSGYSPDFSRYEAKKIKETLVGSVQELDDLYTSGMIDTPEGQARQNEILQLYNKYAPSAPTTVRLHDRDGNPIAYTIVGKKDPKAPLVTELQKRAFVTGLTGASPVLGSLVQAAMFASDVLKVAAPGVWGGGFTTDLDAMTSWVRSTFESWQEQSPLFDAAFNALAVAPDVVAVPNVTGALGVAWSDGVKLV